MYYWIMLLYIKKEKNNLKTLNFIHIGQCRLYNKEKMKREKTLTLFLSCHDDLGFATSLEPKQACILRLDCRLTKKAGNQF